MKQIFLILFLIFSTADYSLSVPLYNVVDTTYHIYGSLGYTDGPNQLYEKFDITSKDSIESTVSIESVPPEQSQNIHSIAKPGYLYSKVYDGNGDGGYTSATEAWCETIFSPLFNGSGPTLNFFYSLDYPRQMEISMTDNTTGNDILYQVFGDPEDPDPFHFVFEYDDWNMEHTYSLKLWLEGGADAVGYHEYELGTNFPIYASVPEPATLFLIGLSIVTLIGCNKFSRTQLISP